MPSRPPTERECLLPHALKLKSLRKLSGKRIVLASNSPRRKQILETFGLAPEIVPSTFAEDLRPDSFADVHEYPVATATHKAVEVYERLLEENLDDGPDLVIGADTVVITTPPSFSSSEPAPAEWVPEVLEKPIDQDDQLRMLYDLNDGVCEVVTGVSLVYPVITAPGYSIKSIDERTLVHFAANSRELLNAYADSGEGLDRAGGFAIQGMGGMLIKKLDGDFNNVVGFPAASFLKFLQMLIEDEDDFLEV